MRYLSFRPVLLAVVLMEIQALLLLIKRTGLSILSDVKFN
jgi:hypothetical protein